MSAPLVSILMPVYNGGKFLAEAVSSVTSQSAGNFELLIIDDGSTDDSATLAASFSDARIRVLKNESNVGLVKTLNRGLAEARGEWIARCDADDVWLPAKLETQLTLSRQNPDLVLIGTNATLIDEHGRFRGQFRTPLTHDLLYWDLCFRNPFVHSTVLFRRAIALEELGGYQPIPAAEDYDLWSRMAATHRIAAVPEALVRYRLHGSSVMAVENAEGRKKSYSHLKQIMAENLRNISGSSVTEHLEAWLEPASNAKSLRSFWTAYDEAWHPYRAKHNLSYANLVLGEHVLSMLYRQRRFSRSTALAFVRTLTVEQLAAMPWLRATAALLLPS